MIDMTYTQIPSENWIEYTVLNGTVLNLWKQSAMTLSKYRNLSVLLSWKDKRQNGRIIDKVAHLNGATLDSRPEKQPKAHDWQLSL